MSNLDLRIFRLASCRVHLLTFVRYSFHTYIMSRITTPSEKVMDDVEAVNHDEKLRADQVLTQTGETRGQLEVS